MITGDGQGNNVSICFGDGELLLGVAEPGNYYPSTYDLIEDATTTVKVRVLGGRDSVEITSDCDGEDGDQVENAELAPWKVTVELGGGDDTFGAMSTHVQSLRVLGAAGHDGVSVSHSTVVGNFYVAGAGGNDHFSSFNVRYGSVTALTGGGAMNTISFHYSTVVDGPMRVQGGAGSERVTIMTSDLANNPRVSTGGGADTVNIASLNFLGQIRVDTGGGADSFQVGTDDDNDEPLAGEEMDRGSIWALMGGGDDDVTVYGAILSGDRYYGGSGLDSITAHSYQGLINSIEIQAPD